MTRSRDDTQRRLQELEEQLKTAQQELEVARRQLSELQSASNSELAQTKAKVDELRSRVEAFEAEKDGQLQAELERKRVSSRAPAFLKTIGCQKEGDGFRFWYEAVDSDGAPIPCAGKVKLTVGETPRVGDGWMEKFFEQEFDVSGDNYKNVTVGLGEYKRTTTVYAFPRIPWTDVSYRSLAYPRFMAFFDSPDLRRAVRIQYRIEFRSTAGLAKFKSVSLSEDLPEE